MTSISDEESEIREEVRRIIRRRDFFFLIDEKFKPDSPRRWREFKEVIKNEFQFTIMPSEREKRQIFEDFLNGETYLRRSEDELLGLTEDGGQKSNLSQAASPTRQSAVKQELQQKLPQLLVLFETMLEEL